MCGSNRKNLYFKGYCTMDVAELKRAADGRWHDILTAAGIPAELLDGRGHSCPKMCGTNGGGDDRFAALKGFENHGAVHCRGCLAKGSGGDGIASIAWIRSCSNGEAIKWLANHLGIANPSNGKPKIAETYDYTDERGSLLFQVVRFEPKDFRQRRPDGNGGWNWSVKGIRKVPFNLQTLVANPERPVFVVEGEKDVLNLAGIGVIATCNAGGAGKWTSEHAAFLSGRQVVIVPDCDEAGRKHAISVLQSLQGVAETVECRDLLKFDFSRHDVTPPEKYDISDWIKDGGNKEKLLQLLNECPVSTIADLEATDEEDEFGIANAFDFVSAHPQESDPLIDGLLRIGETANIISATKVGKSWLALNLAFCVATGTPWLGFEVKQGRALIIDNELTPSTLAARLRMVAAAYGVGLDELGDSIQLLSLRGRLINLGDLTANVLSKIEPGQYQLIGLDAFYRFLPEGINENDNAAIAQVFNCLDASAGRIGAAFVGVHHGSKGDQSMKAVTDVGAGAGSMSRAVDAHIVLRAHELAECSVFEASVRSFKPVRPLTVKFEFPRWIAKQGIEPAVKTPKRSCDAAQESRDAMARQELWEEIPEEGRISMKQLRDATGYGYEKMNRILRQLRKANSIVEVREENKEKGTRYICRAGNEHGESPDLSADPVRSVGQADRPNGQVDT